MTASLALSFFLAGPGFSGYFNSGNHMAESHEYRTLYGVPIAPARRVQLDRLSRHPMNPQRRADGDASRLLVADIKDEGLDKFILITADYEVLRGWRRVEASRKAGEKTIMAEMVVGKLDPKNPKDEVTLTKLIYRDNFLRQDYTAEEVEAFILKRYGKERILAVLPRGPKVSKSERSLLPLERVIEQEMGMSQASAKVHLAAIRRTLKNEAAADRRLSLTDDAERTGLSMARRWMACEAKREKAERMIAKLRERNILPLTREMKEIERDLRKIGGLDRFVRKLR